MLLNPDHTLQCAKLPAKVDSDVTYCSITIPFQVPNRGSSPRTVLAFFFFFLDKCSYYIATY